MPLPPLNEHGLLPEGIHDCTMAELAACFGCFQSSDQRPKLLVWLQQYLALLRRTGLGGQLIVDGSFVTAKPYPNDIDLILVLPIDHDTAADLTPDEYNVVSKKSAETVRL